jgi:hypothetical protein
MPIPVARDMSRWSAVDPGSTPCILVLCRLSRGFSRVVCSCSRTHVPAVSRSWACWVGLVGGGLDDNGVPTLGVMELQMSRQVREGRNYRS